MASLLDYLSDEYHADQLSVLNAKEQSIQLLQKNIDNTKVKLQELNEQNELLENEISSKEANIENLKNQIQEMKSKISLRNASDPQVIQRINQATSLNADNKIKLATLDKQLTEKSKELESLKQSLVDRENSLYSNQINLALRKEGNEERMRLEKQVKVETECLVTLQKEKQTLSQLLQEKTQTFEATQSTLNLAKEEYNQAKVQIEKAETQIDDDYIVVNQQKLEIQALESKVISDLAKLDETRHLLKFTLGSWLSQPFSFSFLIQFFVIYQRLTQQLSQIRLILHDLGDYESTLNEINAKIKLVKLDKFQQFEESEILFGQNEQSELKRIIEKVYSLKNTILEENRKVTLFIERIQTQCANMSELLYGQLEKFQTLLFSKEIPYFQEIIERQQFQVFQDQQKGKQKNLIALNSDVAKIEAILKVISLNLKTIKAQNIESLPKLLILEGQLIHCLNSFNDIATKLQLSFESIQNSFTDFSKLLTHFPLYKQNDPSYEETLTFETNTLFRDIRDRILDYQSIIEAVKNDQILLKDQFSADFERTKESQTFIQELTKLQTKVEGYSATYQQYLKDWNSLQMKNASQFNQIAKVKEAFQNLFVSLSRDPVQEIKVFKEANVKVHEKYRKKEQKYRQLLVLNEELKEEIAVQEHLLLDALKRCQNIQNTDLFKTSFMGSMNEEFKGHFQDLVKVQQTLKAPLGKIKGLYRPEDFAEIEQICQKVIKTVKIDDLNGQLTRIKSEMQQLKEEIRPVVQEIIAKLETYFEDLETQIRIDSLLQCEDMQNELSLQSSLIRNEINEIERSCHQDQQNTSYIKTVKIQLDIIEKTLLQNVHQNDAIPTMVQHKQELQNALQQAQDIMAKLIEIKAKSQSHQSLQAVQQKLTNDKMITIKQIEEIRQQSKIMISKINDMVTQCLKRVEELTKLNKTLLMSQEELHCKKKSVQERKLQKLSQVKVDCKRYNEDVDLFQNLLQKPYSNQEELSTLRHLLHEFDTMAKTLKIGEQELTEQLTHKFPKRQLKLGDCDLSELIKLKQNDLGSIFEQDQLIKQSLEDLETNLNNCVNESSNDVVLSPQKKATQFQQLSSTLSKIKGNYKDFSTKLCQVSDQVRDLKVEIENLNGFKAEKLVECIMRLNEISSEIKILKLKVESLKANLVQQQATLESMDTDKRGRQLLANIESQETYNENVLKLILTLIDLQSAYTGQQDISSPKEEQESGAASSDEDKEFFAVIGTECRELLSEHNGNQKSLKNIKTKLLKIVTDQNSLILSPLSVSASISMIQNQGECESPTETNKKMNKIEARLQKLTSDQKDIEQLVKQIKTRVSCGGSGIDGRLNRRKREAEELSRIVEEINFDACTLREKIDSEKDCYQKDPRYSPYISRLQPIQQQSDQLNQKLDLILEDKNNLLIVTREALQNVADDFDIRLELLHRNVELKKRIQQTLKSIHGLKKLARALFEAAQQVFSSKKKLTLPIVEQPQVYAYKPITDDEIDKMFYLALAKHNFCIPAKRLGGGYYTLGSKKVYCKILGNRLVVRVGGGYMEIGEFIDQYGQSEAEKHLLNQEAAERVLLKRAQQDKLQLQHLPSASEAEASFFDGQKLQPCVEGKSPKHSFSNKNIVANRKLHIIESKSPKVISNSSQPKIFVSQVDVNPDGLIDEEVKEHHSQSSQMVIQGRRSPQVFIKRASPLRMTPGGQSGSAINPSRSFVVINKQKSSGIKKQKRSSERIKIIGGATTTSGEQQIEEFMLEEEDSTYKSGTTE